MNNTLHIKVSNALPGMFGQTGPPLAREKPLARQKLKGKRQKLEVRSQKSEVERQKTKSSQPAAVSIFPHLGGNVRRTKGVTWNFELGTLNLEEARGKQLLYLRDGSSAIRDPIKDPDEERYIPAQSQNPFVRLCEISVISVVKKNTITMELQNHTGQHKAISLLNTKDSPQALHGSKPHAGGKFLNLVMGY